MKKIAFFSALAALMLAGCGNSDKQKETYDYQGPTAADSLRMALATQDSLISLVNDITADMITIRQMEGIIVPDEENISARQSLHDNMQNIQQTLQQRRERLEELEKKLRATNRNNSVLEQTIANLKTQISEQELTIASLTQKLDSANITIRNQEGTIDSLSNTIAAVNEAKQQAEEQNVKLTDDMNTCYYVVGSKKYLNDNGLIHTRFLRSTKVLPGDVDSKFFTKADRRTLAEINCHSKKAEIMTNQPQSSYEFITEANGDKILVIKNADEFWKKSPYLVIKID